MNRILTGIQPSGELHLGNYFGAVQPCLRHQENPSSDLLMFIADYHALTTVHDGVLLSRNSLNLAEGLLALGIDPEQTILFQQSDVEYVAELTLLLTMVTGMGTLQRSPSYKDKVAKGITPSVGLFIYPMIMAADILLYQSDIVPVGKDQTAHVKMARQIGTHFNETFGPVFNLPKAVLSEVPKVPGLDGEKMSKSYGNTISVFDRGNTLRAKLAGIKTTSTPFGEPLPIDDCHLFELIKLMCSTSAELEEVTQFFRTGRRGSKKFGYGHAKELLAEKIETTFAEANERRQDFLPHRIEVIGALSQGATKARRIAKETLDKCRSLCGIG